MKTPLTWRAFVLVGESSGPRRAQPRQASLMPVAWLLSSQDYPPYPGFPQSQYPQYYSSSYNPPYVPAGSICPSPLSTSTYVLQETPHNVPNQSSESLAGTYVESPSRASLVTVSSELLCKRGT